ncbi:MAG: AMP-binding protein, partial [Dehalococcoidia bacterium]|nr:AMP-binding protein [Dehalococcoidia bacterium]
MNTVEFVRIPALTVPDKECLVFEDRRFTYAELYDRVARLAAGLARIGVTKGDKVAILQTNSNEYIETYYAVSMLGAVFVPLNFRARAEELAYLITNSDTTTLLVGDRYLANVDAIRTEIPTVRRFVSIDSARPGMECYARLIDESDPDCALTMEPAEVDDNDCSILMYTSGTTALPKGVILTYGGFTEYVLTSVDPATEES